MVVCCLLRVSRAERLDKWCCGQLGAERRHGCSAMAAGQRACDTLVLGAWLQRGLHEGCMHLPACCHGCQAVRCDVMWPWDRIP